MISRCGIVLLVGPLVLLIDHHQAHVFPELAPDVAKGGEDRAPRAQDYAVVAAMNTPPLVEALTGAEPRMQQRDLPSEAAAKAIEKLRGEGDLRHQHDDAPATFEAGVRGLHVYLGLPAAGHPVKQESCHCSWCRPVKRGDDPVDGDLLVASRFQWSRRLERSAAERIAVDAALLYL